MLLDDLVDIDGEDDLSLEIDPHPLGSETPLEELAASAMELTGAPPELVPPPAEPAAPPAVPLTKFRRAVEAADANGGSALGRIPIVRVKKGDKSKPSYLGRLLASF